MKSIRIWQAIVTACMTFYGALSNGSTCKDGFNHLAHSDLTTPELSLSKLGKWVLFPSYGYIMEASISTLKPHTGPGHYIVARLHYSEDLNRHLVGAVAAAPRFFKKFDVHLIGNTLVIPNSRRLNPLMQNGLQFEDRPFFRGQFYSRAQFNTSLQRGVVQLGSRAAAFQHDRFVEHMMGAFVMPSWMVKRMQTYAVFETAAPNLPSFKKSWRARRRLLRAISVSDHYDRMTFRLGLHAWYIARARTQEELTLEIGELSDALSLGNSFLDAQQILREIEISMKLSPAQRDQFRSELERLGSVFDLSPVSKEFALAEAHRIADEIRR